jgi:bifunctional enzyme CysN/CysC
MASHQHASRDIAAPARSEEPRSRPILRVLTCGSVDDGKSTLIGRLLFDEGLIFDDHLESLVRDSQKHGSAEKGIDYALLLDGLEAERQQGITIDVAYRYFSTGKRSFIVADAPGHEQYTRNMATGASNSDVAVVLVDARKGVRDQTCRHAIISSLFGIRHLILAVNKMDLVGFDQAVFDSIASRFRDFAERLEFTDVVAIPISARFGDNLVTRSLRTPWFTGAPLLTMIEDMNVTGSVADRPFRMSVQWVSRPNLDFRGLAGTVSSGVVRPGDEVILTSSGRTTRVKEILSADRNLELAEAGDAVTLVLADEIDAGRGELLAAAEAPPLLADQFSAHLIWMGAEPLFPGRTYFLKIGTRLTTAVVTELKHRVDVTTLATHAAKTIALNEVAFCNLATSGTIAFDAYSDNRDTGAFILIDRFSNETVGAGMISFALRRSANLHRQDLAVTKAARVAIKNHQPAIVWFTGLSGAGKSTIANAVEFRLHELGAHTILLDGDNVRHGLNKDLGFTHVDRVENIRRIGEIAKLMTEAGLIVLCSFISPFRAERRTVRELVGEEFIEVFVDTPIDVCIARDPKGLYKRALLGEIKNFTGLDQGYEKPEHPEVHLLTTEHSAEALADQVLLELRSRRVL